MMSFEIDAAWEGRLIDAIHEAHATGEDLVQAVRVNVRTLAALARYFTVPQLGLTRRQRLWRWFRTSVLRRSALVRIRADFDQTPGSNRITTLVVDHFVSDFGHHRFVADESLADGQFELSTLRDVDSSYSEMCPE